MEIKIKKIKNDEIEKPKRKIRKAVSKKEKVIVETLETIDNTIQDNIVETQELEPINIQSLEWQYEIKEKNIFFYCILFGLSALFIYLAYKYSNWFLALIVILGFVMIIQRNSKIDNFKINEFGAMIQNQVIEWANIDKCGIETLNETTLLIAIVPNTFPNLKIYVPFLKEKEREVLYLINKYSKLTDLKSNTFDQIVKKIMF